MTEPIFDVSTERLYDNLPEVYRNEDEEQSWVLKKWLSGLVYQLGEVDDLITRFTYVPPEDGPGYRTSDLTDPETADAAWLPWLAQLVSVRLDTGTAIPDQRASIENSILGIKAGSKKAIAQAAASALVGTKTVKVFDHSDATHIGTASQWDILIVTADSETLQNSLPVAQATFASTNGWTSDSWYMNLIGNVSWTTTGMTASTGSTNPLLATYDTFSGAGNTYSAQVAIPGVKYEGSVMLRCTDGLATSASLVLEFMNGGSSLATTTTAVTGIGTSWQRAEVSAVAPASTTNVRLKLVRSAAGVLQASNKMISGINTPLFFDSTFAGASTEDTTNTTYPVTNFWRNSSYDVSGGVVVSNGALTTTTDRFKYGNSAGLFTISGTSDPYLSPDYAVPTFQGEAPSASVFVLGYQDGAQARMELRTTLADGTTSSVFGSWTDVVDEDFVQVSVAQTSPQNAKTFRVYLHFQNMVVGDRFYIDGGLTLRAPNNLGYFDGNRTGNTWSDANHANAITTHNSTLPVNIVTENFYSDSNAVRVTTVANDMAIKVQMNPSLNPITVVATDPWTFMLSAYPLQNGNYYAVFQAVYYNSSNAETGRTSGAYPMTTAMQVTPMVLQANTPAATTKVRLRVYIYGGQQGDQFGVTKAGARLGSVTDWVGVTANPIAAVLAAGAKPAGVILHSQAFSATWAAITAALPLWSDWNGKTWAQIEEVGLG